MQRSPVSVAVSNLLDSEMREPELPEGWERTIDAMSVREELSELRAAASLIKSSSKGGKREDKQAHKLALLTRVARVASAIAAQKPEHEWELESSAYRDLVNEVQEAAKRDGLPPIRVQKNTTIAGLITRGIFGKDRHLASVFSKAIENAAAEGVGPDGLAAWVKDHGGLENARRGIGAADALRQMWQTPPLATIPLDSKIVGIQDGDIPKVLLATVRPSGEVDIRCVVKNDIAAKRALSVWKP